jgi:hypothetical protein
VNITLPTRDQVYASGRHVVSFSMGIVAGLAAVHAINGPTASGAGDAISQISSGMASVIAGVTTLVTIISGLYAAFSASPLSQLFKGSAAVASDPAKMQQLEAATFDQKASLVKVTDKLPEVAAIGTTATAAGRAIETAVQSNTVQSIAKGAA